MKKTIALLALAGLLAAPLTLLGGCNTIQTEGGDLKDIKGRPLTIASFVDLSLDKPGQNGNVNLFYEAKQKYEKENNAAITFKLYNEQIFQNKLIQMVGSGNAPDLVYCGTLHMPRFAAMQLLQPIDEFMDPAAVNYPDTAASIMWGGKHYAARVEQIQPYVIWYNKKIFQKNGITEPYTLWKEGKWNWEKFREVGMALTQDTDKNGETDLWGFDTSGIYTPMWANAGKWFKVDDNKNVTITWKEPAFYNGLKFMQTAVQTDKWWCPDPIAGYNQFATGNFAMIGEPFEFSQKYAKNMDTSLIACAPWPQGPNFQENGGKYYTACNIIGIANGAKNPYGAAAYCSLITELEKGLDRIPLGNAEAEKYLSEQDWEVLDHVRNNALIDSLGWGEWDGSKWFYPIVTENQDISTVLDSLESVLKNEINKTMSYKLPEIEDFKEPEPRTFENGDMGYMTTDGCAGSASITTASGETLAGKSSLKLKLGGTEKAALRTDPGKLKIPGYHSYKVSFDYKFLKVDEACKEYGLDLFVTMRPLASVDSDAYQTGYIALSGVDGDTGTATGEINLNTGEADICLTFVNGITGGGEIAIDNLQITEIPT